MNEPHNQMTWRLHRYGLLLLDLENKADPIKGMPHACALMSKIRNAQHYIATCYSNYPALTLWRFLTVRQCGKDSICLPTCSIMCYILIRFKLLSEQNTMISEVSRIASQACSGVSIDFMYRLIQQLVNARRLEFVEDDYICHHISLTPLFMKYYGFPCKPDSKASSKDPVISDSSMIERLNKMSLAALPYSCEVRNPVFLYVGSKDKVISK